MDFPWESMINNCFVTVIGTEMIVCSSYETKETGWTDHCSNVFTSSNTSPQIQVVDALESRMSSPNCPFLYVLCTPTRSKTGETIWKVWGVEAFMLGWCNLSYTPGLLCWRQGVRRTWNRNSKCFSKEISLLNCSVFKFHADTLVVTGRLFSKVSSSNWERTLVVQGSSYHCTNPNNALLSRENRAFSQSTEYTI